jgi:rubrerythrin
MAKRTQYMEPPEEYEDGMEAEAAPDIEEGEFVGICDVCGVDVNENTEKLCPNCGAIYHELCVKNLCKRCKSRL